MVERFLDRYQLRWKRSSRDIDREFANHPEAVRELLTGWAEKKLAGVTASEALPTLQSNIMFKQLLYDGETINFGSIGTTWKKKVDIADELTHYKPWWSSTQVRAWEDERTPQARKVDFGRRWIVP